MHSVCVDLVSVVMVGFDVIGGAMAIRPPRRDGCRRRRWARRWGWILIGARKTTAPMARWPPGPPTLVIQPEGSSTRLPHDGAQTLAASGSPETAT